VVYASTDTNRPTALRCARAAHQQRGLTKYDLRNDVQKHLYMCTGDVVTHGLCVTTSPDFAKGVISYGLCEVTPCFILCADSSSCVYDGRALCAIMGADVCSSRWRATHGARARRGTGGDKAHNTRRGSPRIERRPCRPA